MALPSIVDQFRRPPVWAVLGASLLLWQIATWIIKPSPLILPDPISIFWALVDNPWLYAINAWHTIANTLVGFFGSIVIGVALAVCIVYSPFLEATLYTLLVAINSMPKVALAPIFVVWFGTGNFSKVAMAFIIAIFAIVIDTVLGLRMMDDDMSDLGRSMRGSPLKLLFKIRLPNALPSMFAGMKVAIGLALVGTLVGEFVSAQRGLGYVIMAAQGAFDTARAFVAILLLSVIGMTMFRMLEFVERRVIPWHVSQRVSKT